MDAPPQSGRIVCCCGNSPPQSKPMGMFRPFAGTAFTAIVALLLTTIAATAQLPQARITCSNLDGTAPPDVAIGACTTVIEAGQDFDKDLAIAFANRASAHIKAGANARAIADATRGIEIDPLSAP